MQSGSGQTERRRWARGRHAAPAPDGKDLPAKLIALVRQRFSYLNDLFNALPDRRSPDDCLYTTATILWMMVLGFLCRKGTRNAMDVDRNTGMAPSNLLALSGQRRWPTGRSVTAPCTETATRLLDILAPGKLEEIVMAVARTLLRGKYLDSARLNQWVLIAIDGTKEESYRRWSAPWRRTYRYVLHAKPIGPDGTAFTLMAEPCDFYDTERGKLDCERAAFQRLARRLKSAFPKLSICLLGDALFACEAVYSTCDELEWKGAVGLELRRATMSRRTAASGWSTRSAKRTGGRPTTTCSCNSPTTSGSCLSKDGSEGRWPPVANSPTCVWPNCSLRLYTCADRPSNRSRPSNSALLMAKRMRNACSSPN